jgi:hypothetical protein
MPLSAREGPQRRDAILSTIEFAAREVAKA